MFRKKWNVLVVEDDPEVAKLLKLQLKSIKLTAEVARNGQEAILVAGKRQPELIVMDLMLPQLDGVEASRYFENKFSKESLPILILTAKDDKGSRERCAEVGCDDYLCKPYDESDLFDAARNLVRLSKEERKREEMERKRDLAPEGKFDQSGYDKLLDRICSERVAVLERLIERGFTELAPLHLERIEAIRPDHEALERLRSKLG